MKAQEILGVRVKYNHEVNGIKIDSRLIKKNDVFIAIKGNNVDGFDYIDEAIENKAKTIVSDDKRILTYEKNQYKINFIYVDNCKKEIANYLKNFYKDISKDLFLIGITGTNGKTTTSTLLYKYFRYLGKNVTLIGTNGVYINDNYYETHNTTPSLVDIYMYLKLSMDYNCNIVIIEVSSQGIKECRVMGLNFKIGLLTNITLDHLDYHKTIEDYIYTKLMFLNTCEKVIVNKNTEVYSMVNQMISKKIITFGNTKCDYEISNEHLDIVETTFDLFIRNEENKYYIMTSLLGQYNIENVAAFISIIDTIGIFNQYTLSFLKKKITIEGRFEIIKTNKCSVVIDFAHTPDGIKKLLDFINRVKTGKVITLIGMGGNRDKLKRPIVGDIVTEHSDYVVFTSDNCRNEDCIQIINEIVRGVKEKNRGKFVIETDRRRAIEFSYKFAKSHDIIVILGKGNEKYQIIGNEYLPFNDKEEVLKTISRLGDYC